ncbi:hypothetical protein HPB48_012034 [Haemaphysalis longicornis]|uniref:Uncharacterized protein n=1 Tax=Haemaphysalis longicornis TaxID=44386 RepID=A0A9J6GGJ2_HAELO|nr:hypothetical protein HPB48_012034 [Haemaphysalis longicornis]
MLRNRSHFPLYKAPFHVDLSRLVFTDRFLQLSTLLPSDVLYGLGQQWGPLRRSLNWTSQILFNKDRAVTVGKNLYGSHPFYLVVEPGGMSHGVLMHNSNFMEVLLQPTPAATFRVLGGILDVFVFTGPSPARVVQQLQQAVGFPAMPPYWGLGFHLCRYGYGSLNKTRKIMEGNIRAGVPFDAQWNDIDSMDAQNGFTYDKDAFAGLPEFVDEVHAGGRRYMLIFDPGVSGSEEPGTYPPFDDGIEMDIFVKTVRGNVKYGKASMKPPYVPGDEDLSNKTFCMSDQHHLSSHYDVHNIYAHLEAILTYRALVDVRGKRPFIISRSTTPGQGAWSGHWSGDTDSNWEHLRFSIPSMLSFGLYGIPLTGSDVCGFFGNTTEQLCSRWLELGAFYPFSRTHNINDSIDQDPYSLGPAVIDAAKVALGMRYSLLPYLYTLFYRSHVYGETVARPLFLEFPEDSNTYDIDEQFLWGSALLFNPVLYEQMKFNEVNLSYRVQANLILTMQRKSVRAYLPHGRWYDMSDGTEFEEREGGYRTLTAPLKTVRVLVRGGYVVPCQPPALTTNSSREAPLVLLVAPDAEGVARGELFWDDGDSIGTCDTCETGWLRHHSSLSGFLAGR